MDGFEFNSEVSYVNRAIPCLYEEIIETSIIYMHRLHCTALLCIVKINRNYAIVHEFKKQHGKRYSMVRDIAWNREIAGTKK